MGFQKGNQLAKIAARRRAALSDSHQRKGRYITRALEEKLNEVVEFNGASKRKIDHILDNMIDEAMIRNNMHTAQYIIERVEGKTPQEIAVSHSHDINLDALNDDELMQLRRIVEKAKADVTDVEFVDVTPPVSSPVSSAPASAPASEEGGYV